MVLFVIFFHMKIQIIIFFSLTRIFASIVCSPIHPLLGKISLPAITTWWDLMRSRNPTLKIDRRRQKHDFPYSTLLWLAHPLLISVSTHQQFWKRESLFILYEKNWLNKEIYLLYLFSCCNMTQKTIHNFFFDAKHLIYSIIIQILGQSEMGLIHILAKKHIVCSSNTIHSSTKGKL